MRKTIRDWAHCLIELTHGRRCYASTGAVMQAHTEVCATLCEKLVEFGQEVLAKQETAPPWITVTGTRIHLGDLDPAVHSSADGMTTRCGIAMAATERTTLYTVTDQNKVTCADCWERLQ